MRVFLTSDLHGLTEAFLSFSRALVKRYDIGVIAGDLLDDHVPDEELKQILGLEMSARPTNFADQKEHQESEKRALAFKEQEIKDILRSAGKPVLVVPGNHDLTALTTNGNFMNIHMKRIEINGQPFVGYGCISRTLGPDLQMALLNEIEEQIDEQTIFVTHIPPQGTLDLKRDNLNGMESFGSRILANTVSRKKPRFHFFGDAHDSVGVNGNSINASYPMVSSFCGVDTDSGEVWTEKGK